MIRADVFSQSMSETPHDPFQFRRAEIFRLESHPAFGASERNAYQRGFEGHPGRQSTHFILIHRRVETQSSFEGPEQIVVLDPVATKHPNRPVIHTHREVDENFVLRFRQDVLVASVNSNKIGGVLELAHCHFKKLRVGGAGHLGCRERRMIRGMLRPGNPAIRQSGNPVIR